MSCEHAPDPGAGGWLERPHAVDGAAMQHASWRSLARLSSGLGRIESFLGAAGFDRAPWLAVAFAAGIAAWFALPRPWHWQALLAAALALAVGAASGRRFGERWPFLRQALIAVMLALGAGCALIWVRASAIGAPPLERPLVATVTGRVADWRELPAEGRGRLTLVLRDPLAPERVIRARIAVPLGPDKAGLGEGAVVRVRARLMPPGPPLVPGAYDFARTAWFAGIAATGSALGLVSVEQPAPPAWSLGPMRRSLSQHIAAALPGSPGGIAAALASGDRGAIAKADEDAMRDAGLTHLLSVSGLHVSAVMAAAYLLVLRLLAASPWLALRLRLPLLAAGAAAGAGVFYTLLTGAEVPTLRSTFAALLALVAVAQGREPLSLRVLALAAFLVMLFWPEAVIGPSFQLSFGAALAIVALHGAGWMRRLSAPSEASWWERAARQAVALLLTGIVVELALLPIGLFHFHRAGLYGALANMVAIPLTTFVIMPLVALALLLDPIGLGAPVWQLAGQSLALLLGLAHLVARQPGAVTLVPGMAGWVYALFLGGGLWLAGWSGRARRWGLLPVAAGAIALGSARPPDVLVSGDGRIVAFTRLVPGKVVVLRPSKSRFALETVAELAGVDGTADPGEGTDSTFVAIDAVPGARCNADYCLIDAGEGAQRRRFLLSRAADPAPVRDLIAACSLVDVVVADRRLPWACRPGWLKADRSLLRQTGGLALWPGPRRIETVAEDQGGHGWAIRQQQDRRSPRPDLGVRPEVPTAQ